MIYNFINLQLCINIPNIETFSSLDNKSISSKRSSRNLNDDKNFKKLCDENILTNLLDNNIIILKNLLEHNYFCNIKLDNVFNGKYTRLISIKKASDKFKNYKSLYFNIKITSEKEKYKCVIKFANNNLIECILKD